MALIANTVRDPKKKPEPYTAIEFMPESMRPPEEPATPEQVFAILQAAFRANRKATN